MLAREEMGKARILLDFWRDVANKGRSISVAEIRRRLDHHEETQRKAQISQTLRGGTEAAKLLRALSDPAEHQSAWQKLEQLTEQQRKRIPTDRHKARMRALYVDLNDFGSGWRRPSEVTDDARAHLNDVANDYALLWFRYQHQPETLGHIEPKLAAALKQWPDRPALPEPARLEFLPDTVDARGPKGR
jgi:AbiV family abortive infection protein